MKIPFFGRSATATVETEEYSCPHLMLSPTWDNPNDMGIEARATGYRCYACSESLTLDEAAEARRRSALAR